MKVKREKEKFNPFFISITIENEEEARALYAIFNLSKNTQLLSEIFCDQIRSIIGDVYYTHNGEISNGVNGRDYYK